MSQELWRKKKLTKEISLKGQSTTDFIPVEARCFFFFFFVPFFWWKIKRPLQQYMAAHSAGGKRQRLTLILLLARSPWSVNINVRETFIHTVCMTPALTKSQPLQLFISKRTDEIVNTKQMLSHLPRSESPPPMKNH